MKRLGLLVIGCFLFDSIINGQDTQQEKEEFKPSGKVTGKVFWNYNYNLTDGATKRNSFEFKRAYFGYSYNFSEKISSLIMFDAAKQTVDSKGKISSEYTVFVKNAYLDYKIVDFLTFSGGIIGLKMMDTQEKFWGYRYLSTPYQDEFKYAATADLGVNAELSLDKFLKLNVFVINGENFANVQDDLGMMRIGGNLIIEPIEGLTLKAYYDFNGGKAEVDINDTTTAIVDTSYIQTMDFWLGYKHEKFRVSAGTSFQKNGSDYTTIQANKEHYGLYANVAVPVTKKIELFGQWMNQVSNMHDKKSRDGNILQAGIQYAPLKGIKTALNYRTSTATTTDIRESFIYLHFEMSF